MFGKRGKYEAVPTAAEVKYKQKSAKSNLLSAYFTSLLCLILCATMFMSTSMAWFTSEVSNSGNEIYVGMLDVKLLHKDGDQWLDLENVDNQNHKILDKNVLWAPETLQVERLQVVNSGNLAFNYRLFMTIDHSEFENDTDKAAKIEKAMLAAQYISVYVTKVTDTYSEPTGFAAIESGWTSLGTLADVFAGKVVFDGSMDSADVVAVDGNGTISSTPTVHEYAIALHMAVDAPADIMQAKLTGINIKLVAAQIASTNSDVSVVSTADELKTAMAKNGTVILVNDIDLAEPVTVPAGVTVTLDLNGHTISGICDDGSDSLILVKNTATLNVKDSTTAKNGKITFAQGASDVGWTIGLEGNLNLYSGTIELTGSAWSIGYAVDIRPNAWGTAYTEGTVFHMYGGKIVSSDAAVRVASSSSESYKDVSASFIMDAGEIVAEWDGVFVQQSNTAYDTLNLTVNGGTITSKLAPVRIYGPYASSVVAGDDVTPMHITVKADSLQMDGQADLSRVWYELGKIMLGADLATEQVDGDKTISCKDYLDKYAEIVIN